MAGSTETDGGALVGGLTSTSFVGMLWLFPLLDWDSLGGRAGKGFTFDRDLFLLGEFFNPCLWLGDLIGDMLSLEGGPCVLTVDGSSGIGVRDLIQGVEDL